MNTLVTTVPPTRTPSYIAADVRGHGRTPRVLQDRVVASVLGAFFAVHRELGGGFVSPVYQRSLALEFAQRGIAHARDVSLSVFYKGTKVGQYQAPFVVDGRVLVDVRAATRLEVADEADVRNALRACGCEAALLLNFGVAASFRHVERPASG